MLQRNFVRAEEGRERCAAAASLGEPRDDAQRLQLVVERETVSGLDLDGRRAERREPAQTLELSELEQLVLDS